MRFSSSREAVGIGLGGWAGAFLESLPEGFQDHAGGIIFVDIAAVGKEGLVALPEAEVVADIQAEGKVEVYQAGVLTICTPADPSPTCSPPASPVRPKATGRVQLLLE